MQWLSEGKLQPHVSHRFTLEELPIAFATLLQVQLQKVAVQRETVQALKLRPTIFKGRKSLMYRLIIRLLQHRSEPKKAHL